MLDAHLDQYAFVHLISHVNYNGSRTTSQFCQCLLDVQLHTYRTHCIPTRVLQRSMNHRYGTIVTHTHTRIHTGAQTRRRKDTHTHTYAYTHRRTNTQAQTHTHTHLRTHRPNYRPNGCPIRVLSRRHHFIEKRKSSRAIWVSGPLFGKQVRIDLKTNEQVRKRMY